jgi:hypothetical protein
MALDVKIRKVHLLIGAAALAAVAAAFGLLEFSSSNTFCYLCHFDARFQEPWRASAHFKEGVHCKDCHFGPGVFGLVDAKWLGAKDAAIALTTGEDFNNVEIYTHAREEKCRKCHNAYRKVNVVAGDDLPSPLGGAVESLAFDHRRHDEARAVCERCHRPEVFFFGVSYMTCEACHAGLVHKRDEKYDAPVPRADRCSRCHTGRVHVWGARAQDLDDAGLFFFNDCPARTKTIYDGVLPAQANCERCHPPLAAAGAGP